MRISKLLCCLCCILLITTVLSSQTKNEQEERVDLDKFPDTAISLIKTLPKDCKKFKFYKETDNDHKSFEVKFKYNKQRYSIEFATSGMIEDIEVTVKFKSLQKTAKATVEVYFEKEFEKTKILKTQKQYVFENLKSSGESIKRVLNNKSDIAPNYEIIAEVKTKSERTIREFTFSNSGKIIKTRVLNSASYEHILH